MGRNGAPCDMLVVCNKLNVIDPFASDNSISNTTDLCESSLSAIASASSVKYQAKHRLLYRLFMSITYKNYTHKIISFHYIYSN